MWAGAVYLREDEVDEIASGQPFCIQYRLDCTTGTLGPRSIGHLLGQPSLHAHPRCTTLASDHICAYGR